MEYYEDLINPLKQQESTNEKIKDVLISITLSIASLYCKLCHANEETPDRLMADLVDGEDMALQSLPTKRQIEYRHGLSELQNPLTDLPASLFDKLSEDESISIEECLKLISYISHQVTLCKEIVEIAIDRPTDVSIHSRSSSDAIKMNPEICKLRAEATLHHNATTHETEKEIMAKTISRLSTELCALREEVTDLRLHSFMVSDSHEKDVKYIDNLQLKVLTAEARTKVLDDQLSKATQEKEYLKRAVDELTTKTSEIAKISETKLSESKSKSSNESVHEPDQHKVSPTDVKKKQHKSPSPPPPPWSYFSKRSQYK